MILENSDTYSVTCSCRRLLFFVLAVALMFGAVCVGGVSGANWIENVASKWSGGSGTLDDPYEISSGEELALLAQNVNAGNSYSGTYFELTADIDLGGKTWTPIGNNNNYFAGSFDGGKNIIDNISIEYDAKNIKCHGIFGCVANPGYIKDTLVGFSEFDIKSDASIGSLVGLLKGGKVENCSVISKTLVTVGSNGQNKFQIGGLIGKITPSSNSDKTISADDLDEYLLGSCTVYVFDTSYNKENGIGWIVGAPNIDVSSGGGSGDDPESPPVVVYAYYNVSIYVMDISGNYSSPQSTEMRAGVGETTAYAMYTVEDGFSLDTKNSSTSGEILADHSLHLKVYLKRNEYTITFMNDGNKVETITARYEVPLQVLPVPIKPGHEFIGWNPAIPSTMPAQDMTVHAVWEYINPIFTITIPEDIPLDNSTLEGSKYVGVDITQLSDIGNLSITVSSANSYHLVLKNHPEISLNYNLFIDGSSSPAVQDGVVGLFKDPVSTQIVKSIPIRAVVNETPRYSGSYSDALTFTVKYTETN